MRKVPNYSPIKKMDLKEGWNFSFLLQLIKILVLIATFEKFKNYLIKIFLYYLHPNSILKTQFTNHIFNELSYAIRINSHNMKI